MSEQTSSSKVTTMEKTSLMSNPYFLSRGSHTNAKSGRCAMEWVAYLANERHSDRPVCVSPVLTTFCVSLNDRLPDDERQKLRPYLARTIGTRGDGRDEERVALCREWLLHTALPAYMDAAGRSDTAARLRTLPNDLTPEAVRRTIRQVFAARDTALGRLKDKVRAELAGIAAAADAVAVAAGDPAADSVAVAVANAVVITDADGYSTIRSAIYDRVYARALETRRRLNAQLTPGAFDLLDRMLPTEVIPLPVASDAALVCGVTLGA